LCDVQGGARLIFLGRSSTKSKDRYLLGEPGDCRTKRGLGGRGKAILLRARRGGFFKVRRAEGDKGGS